MFSIPVRVLLFTLLLLQPVLLPAQGTGGQNQVIEWDPVDGASRYLVELYFGEMKITEASAVAPRFVTFLNPGEYRYRITVFNKFGKPVSVSDWETLTVLEALQPAVKKVEPSFLYSNNGGKGSFLMEIANLEEGAEIHLRQGTSRIKGEIERSGDSLYRVVFTDPRLGKPGTFDLEVSNPSGLRDLNAERIAVREIAQPEIDGVIPSLAESGSVMIRILLNGWGFAPETEVWFTGAVTWKPAAVYFESPEKIYLNMDLRDIPPGLYTIVLKNPSGLQTEKWGVFTIVDPDIVDLDEVVINEKTGKIKQRRTYGSRISGISGGYHYSLMSGSMEEFFNTAPVGADLRLRLAFKNDFFQKTPFLRQLALDIGASWTLFNISDYGDYQFQVITAETCLLYKTPFPFFLNWLFRAGGGVSLSTMKGDGILGIFDSTSLDFQLVVGTALEISLADAAFFELGAMARWQILLSGNNIYLQPYALFGIYF
jgi:hypothetical protein